MSRPAAPAGTYGAGDPSFKLGYKSAGKLVRTRHEQAVRLKTLRKSARSGSSPSIRRSASSELAGYGQGMKARHRPGGSPRGGQFY